MKLKDENKVVTEVADESGQKSRSRSRLYEDGTFQEPKEMISLSPPTGSVYLKTDELKLQKQKSSLSTSVNFASKLFGMMLFSLALIIYAF